MQASPEKLTTENFNEYTLRFRDRQAGVGLIYNHEKDSYSYNAYCLETELLKELFTQEFDYLTDALSLINSEFGTWELKPLVPSSNCSSCVAK